MALSNHERVGKAMEHLKQGLAPFIEREFTSVYKEHARVAADDFMRDDPMLKDQPFANWDAAALLRLMWQAWNPVFSQALGSAQRNFVKELQNFRNDWAHQKPFSTDDAYRAIDTASRLLRAVSAPDAEATEAMKTELMRLNYAEQVRTEKRKSMSIESQAAGQLKPWREVITPHKDVASGRYQQAEFAADLWQVHMGEGTDEYRNPEEFFRRTYLTESLKSMLVGAVKRLTSGDGDPVVQLQTNFGGGKTHSMLALYHLFSGAKPETLLGIDAVMKVACKSKLPKARCVVLVGDKLSAGNPQKKPDGCIVHTIWGELAWQLGGKQAYERVRLDDERATNPGAVLRELFNEYGPCLILVDEWVAYARQLHDKSDLPAGSFETQFTFAQALTESATAAKQCLLVISLPASDMTGSPHAQADDVEVGGQRGREALDRLRNVIGRVDAPWRPASAEEGFEIVRRRLFEPLAEKQHYVARDTVAREFAEMYRTQQQEFPPDCRDVAYQKRLQAAYPIHPEVFDRLYTDWSTLVKFQRTRGVLRLMATVIHCLWESNDRNPLILPANIPIDEPRVQSELTRSLSDNWVPIIEKDVDGPNALPLRIDGEVPNLGKFAACRRVARTIYLGSAPTHAAANRGLEDRRVRLGCMIPGESPAVFGDALRRLAASATYLYQDGPRYWYSTQPTVTKVAEDRAEQLKRDPDKVVAELERRLRLDLRKTGDFTRIHACPRTGQDVPDDHEARLVVLGVDHPYSKESGNAAEAAAKTILESRGNSPRIFRNTLVFLAVDKQRLQEIDEAVRRFLAWESIVGERDALDLSPHQVKQAEAQRASANSVVDAQLPEAWQWLLVPTQSTPQAAIEWQVLRNSGHDALAVRASKKLRNDDLLVTSFGATPLRNELDKVPLWRGDHVAIKQLVDDFARYIYLPRLLNPQVLVEAIKNGLSSLSWSVDSFAIADCLDEAAARYRGLQAGQVVHGIGADSTRLLVRPEVATRQTEALRVAEASASGLAGPGYTATASGAAPATGLTAAQGRPSAPEAPPRPKRFHATVKLDPVRAGRDAGRVAEEIITHLAGIVGADVTITLEIEARVPSGVPDHVVRTVTENSRTLKLESHGFERE